MKAFDVVEALEHELAGFTGAPYVVTVDSCTNALFLSMLYFGAAQTNGNGNVLKLPRHTYIGVAQSAINAGFAIEWTNEQWESEYKIQPFNLYDAAKRFERGMYRTGSLTCVSFHIAKLLKLGRGGAILCDSADAAAWLRRVRFDGRTSGQTGQNATQITSPGYHMYMTPDVAARGLWLLETIDQPLDDRWDKYPDISALLP